MRLKRLALAGILALALSASFGANAQSDLLECWEGPAVLDRNWNLVSLAARDEIPLGEWRLPVSSTRPEILTQARVALTLVRKSRSAPWRVRVIGTFPDPQTLGFPYQLKGVVASYEVNGVKQTQSLDWTVECSGPGHELWQNGAPFEAEMELPGIDGLLARNLRIEVFGIRF